MIRIQTPLLESIPLVREDTALFTPKPLALGLGASLALNGLAYSSMHIRACSTHDRVGRRNEGFFACLWMAGARDVDLRIRVGLEGAVGGRGSWW
jgi:hypothetical protein